MANFPGIAMIIDDQYYLVHQGESKEREVEIQRQSNLQLKKFLDDHHIPYTTIIETHDIAVVKNKIKGYDNVRLIVLDLDLNNDGEVGDIDDVVMIKVILEEAIKKYGYFFLLISSAHSEKWVDIKQELKESTSIFTKANSAVNIYDKKKENIADILMELQTKNFSLELIYDFETSLNHARDKAFNGIIDYEKRTWNKIYAQLIAETNSQASFILANSYLSLLRQHLLGVRFSPPQLDDPIEESLAKKAFNMINYIDNNENQLNTHPIWTGNLYRTSSDVKEAKSYALVVTPECDIAQNKIVDYQIVYGYEINETTFPSDYDHNNYSKEKAPPLHAYKSGMKKNKWRDKDNLKDTGGFTEHMYVLPFVSDNRTVVLDFRDISHISKEELNNFRLIKRINEPMITDILDKISLLFNRKGLLPLLPLKIKAITH